MRPYDKKIYCSSCRQLVKGQEMGKGNIQLLCSRCGKPLYIWNGITWRLVRQGA